LKSEWKEDLDMADPELFGRIGFKSGTETWKDNGRNEEDK